ncbi:MAG: NADH-quinone oxidoreductase subunit N [Planctomycetota bacterium]|nr:NADH-quinone oxidoreductase subunit N [Planctomycetota bacterium]
MNYEQLVQSVIGDTESSLEKFLPELVLCGTILLMLLSRLFTLTKRLMPSWLLASSGVAFAFLLAEPWKFLSQGVPLERTEIFTGMLVHDAFTVYFRAVLLFTTFLFILLARISRLADQENGPDFYTLVLGAALGMCLMAEANHLLIVFLAVEMASLPSYTLAGILKGNRQSSEASMKYAVYGAGAAGVMLYGTSLIAGITGSAHLPTIAWRLAEGMGTDYQLVLVLSGLMMLVGLAFKLSAVPFHFWCPDVFEGASAEVAGFLSVASKAAALALLVRLAVGFAVPPATEPVPFAAGKSPVNASVAGESSGQSLGSLRPIAYARPVADSGDAETASAEMIRVSHIRTFLAWVIGVLAAVTSTFGNLTAYGQTNIKRLLAYSTIAHAGYMMMPIAAGLALMTENPAAASEAFAALLLYVLIYVFMNMGAFGIIAFIRNAVGGEQISDYAGLVRSSPGWVVCFSAILFSLIGLPPLAGFMGKLVIFASLVDAGMYWLLFIGGVNTAISLFYYLKVVRVMTFDPEPEGRPSLRMPLVSLPGVFTMLMTAPILLLIIQWNGLYQWAEAACKTVLGN